MLPGETVRSGADPRCSDCGLTPQMEVLSTPAGYYIGTQCNCGPKSRESHYYRLREDAQRDLDLGTVDWRT